MSIEGSCNILTKKGETPDYSVSVYAPNKISKCKLGQELGYIEILVNNELYSTLKIIANEQIDEPSFSDNLKDIYKDFV